MSVNWREFRGVNQDGLGRISQPCKVGQTLEEAVQRGHGVSILGGFQALTGQDSEQRGLNSVSTPALSKRLG